ncbi:hypothetical protein BU24DRAFT_410764 [Aaosphaeria arxii CBS 175.79]|uniref:Uncharacterized protein n=1 Tax=Aaosphaeria arxii CBS 175.79 TaxID=1450172 RepID=A0A6A5XQB0_9PLEO|nr:uncharacterized protein BU24DRAFT_410764 [Aaosphaeria arxii CBS 175.79]KAF2015086.1 hypothetical protein BU24DRAFT_410764 [Aaosphaeria arxii CBS 175.79]
MMLKAFEHLKRYLFSGLNYKFLFRAEASHTRPLLIPPPAAPILKPIEAKFQLRFEAGWNAGKRTVFLELAAKAKPKNSKEFSTLSHPRGFLASGVIYQNTPPEKQEEATMRLWDDLMRQVNEESEE